MKECLKSMRQMLNEQLILQVIEKVGVREENKKVQQS